MNNVLQSQLPTPPQAETVPTTCAAAEPQQFEALALPHLNDLYRTARRVIGNTTEAEAIVQ